MNKNIKDTMQYPRFFIYLCIIISENIQYIETWTLNQNLKSSYQNYAQYYSDY